MKTCSTTHAIKISCLLLLLRNPTVPKGLGGYYISRTHLFDSLLFILDLYVGRRVFSSTHTLSGDVARTGDRSKHLAHNPHHRFTVLKYRYSTAYYIILREAPQPVATEPQLCELCVLLSNEAREMENLKVTDRSISMRVARGG